MKPNHFSAFNYAMITLFSVILLSCGDKDKYPVNQRGPRLSKMVQRFESSNPTYIELDSAKFLYNDKNILKSMSSFDGVDSIAFVYTTNGSLTQCGFYSQGTEEELIKFAWDGAIITMTDNSTTNTKAVFQLGSDGHVNRIDTYFLLNQSWVLRSYLVYTWVNGNLILSEYWETNGIQSKLANKVVPELLFSEHIFKTLLAPDSSFSDKGTFYKKASTSYTYDNLTNPYRDFQIYKFSEIGYYNSLNNAIGIVTNLYSSSGVVTGTESTAYTFTPNAVNYPSLKSLFSADYIFTEQYTYE